MAQSNDVLIKRITLWQFPKINTIKINCDASWISEHTNAGFGFVIRNWTGTFKGAESGTFRTSTAEEAEALSLLQATNWAITKNLQHLVIEGDNQAIIKHLQGENSTIQWQSMAILEEVNRKTELLSHFLGFNFVDRKANRVADLLDKKGRKNNRHESWLEQSPQFLFPSIAFDTAKAYARCNISNSAVISREITNLGDSVIGRSIHSELVIEETESND